MKGTLTQLHKEMDPLTEIAALLWISEIIDGYKILYKQNIIHRDLKPDNILYDEEYKLKIADFGLSRTICLNNPMTMRGTQLYAAPEQV